MTFTSTTAPTTATLEAPGACLYYELRGDGPLIVLVGAPMDAASFAPLADRLAIDHTVLTTDPRGSGRSRLADPDSDSTPELRADDLSRLLTHVDAGPAAVFGSSGGAVSALALAQAHPEVVHTVVAHEPPLNELLDERMELRAATEDMVTTYLAGETTAAWAKFLSQAGITLPEEVFAEFFGTDSGPRPADERWWFEHELRATTSWSPDLRALRSGPSRIVVGIGEESRGQLCDRTSAALAAALGTEPTTFPGDHTGFVDDPADFAHRLRAILAGG